MLIATRSSGLIPQRAPRQLRSLLIALNATHLFSVEPKPRLRWVEHGPGWPNRQPRSSAQAARRADSLFRVEGRAPAIPQPTRQPTVRSAEGHAPGWEESPIARCLSEPSDN